MSKTQSNKCQGHNPTHVKDNPMHVKDEFNTCQGHNATNVKNTTEHKTMTQHNL